MPHSQNTELTFHDFFFRPAPILRNPHVQTIFSTLGLTRLSKLPSVRSHVMLEDGDAISCYESRPNQWLPFHPTVVLLHGLGGSQDSLFMLRMGRKFLEQGYRVIRMNLRGCGSGIGLSTKPYHGGLSDDLFAVLHHFRKEAPHSHASIVGYSIGGNTALKLAGERGAALSHHVKSIVAVCPPYHLGRVVDKISGHRIKFYERYFMFQMRRQYNKWAAINAHLNPAILPKRLTVEQFDDFHTAPQWGFKNARDYYDKCSSAAFIPHIEIPTHIITVMDDPIIDNESIETIIFPRSVKVWKSPHGGHVGFLGNPWRYSKMRPIDDHIVNLVKGH